MIEKVFRKIDEVRTEVNTVGIMGAAKTELVNAKKKVEEIKERLLAKVREARGKAQAKIEEKKQGVSKESGTRLKGGM